MSSRKDSERKGEKGEMTFGGLWCDGFLFAD